MLQPFEYDPAEKNNHKFMVQSMPVQTATVETLDQLVRTAICTVFLLGTINPCRPNLYYIGIEYKISNCGQPSVQTIMLWWNFYAF